MKNILKKKKGRQPKEKGGLCLDQRELASTVGRRSKPVAREKNSGRHSEAPGRQPGGTPARGQVSLEGGLKGKQNKGG